MVASIFLSGSDIAYEFPNGIVLFKNLHFSLGRGTYGLIGPNGVGKSTLLKLLCGEAQPSHGSLSRKGTLVMLPQILSKSEYSPSSESIGDLLSIKGIVSALYQINSGHASLEAIETIGDNWDIENRVQSIFQSLQIEYLSLDRPIFQLSGGELVKVHLAKVLLESPSIVLLDEPTNNLDQGGREALYQFIEKWSHCMVVVSHDRALLSRVKSIIELSNQGIQLYGGNYEFYLEEREKESSSLEKKIINAELEQKKEKRDLIQSIERQQRRVARGRKKAEEGGIPKIMAGGLKRKAEGSTARLKDVQERRLEEAQFAVKTLKSKIKERNRIQIDIPDSIVHPRKELLEIKNFNFRYWDSPGFLFSTPVTFQLSGPKRVQIRGPNGAGKTTLIKLLMLLKESFDCSRLGEMTGEFYVKTDRVAYLDQSVQILGKGNQSLLERFIEMNPHLPESESRIRLGRFLFTQEMSLKKISDLSGGEKIRAGLACILFSHQPPELLILDEPTNNLDIDSIERIESALSNFKGAILVISHDTEFLKNIDASEDLLLRHRFL